MTKVRVGLIGFGAMGARHAAAAAKSKLIDLVAIADPAKERLQSVVAEHGLLRTYEDGMELLQDEGVDAVVLALPTGLRGPLVMEAFAHGKHVLVEKPVAMNGPELERMIAAKGDVVGACCSSRHRFLPHAEAVTQFLRDQPLGPIRSILIRNFSPAKPRPEKEKPAWRLSRELNGGGILVNWGGYDFDYVLGVLGWSLDPVTVLAQSWGIPPILSSHVAEGSDGETHVAAFIRCAGGEVIQYERAEYLSLSTHAIWEIIGTRGSLRLQMIPSVGKKICYDYLDEEKGACSTVLWEGDEEGAVVHTRPVQDFAEAILEGRSPATTFEQSLIIQKITDAIYASAAQSQAVTLDRSPKT